MTITQLKNQQFDDSIVLEPTVDEAKIVLWIRGPREGDIQYWERISNLQNAQVSDHEDAFSTLATHVHLRQKITGFLGKVQRWLKRADSAYVLPDGEPVETTGAATRNSLLIWGKENSSELDEERIKQRWPTISACRKLGKNLFFVALDSADESSASTSASSHPFEVAKRLLEEAREKQDRRAEAMALLDLGIFLLQARDMRQVVPILEQAVTIYREVQDREGEHQAMAYLAEAYVAKEKVEAAVGLLHPALEYFRKVGNLPMQKRVLSCFGHTAASVYRPVDAIASFDQALPLTRQLGDRRQEADILWITAILHDDLDQKEEALKCAESALEIYNELGEPKAEVLADYLHVYRDGTAPLAGARWVSLKTEEGKSNTLIPDHLIPPYRETREKAGALRRAISASASLGTPDRPDEKTVSAEIHATRIKVCSICEHHSGVRCRVGDCFTDRKAWLPEERCPEGRWPV